MRLVYLSPVPWASFAQRPHKFVEWFHAKCGGEVLWVEPYPTRLPSFADIRRIRVGRGVTVQRSSIVSAPSWLTVLGFHSLPIEPLPGISSFNRLFWSDALQSIDSFVAKGESILCIGKPSALAVFLLERYPGCASLYDAMDDFPAFYTGMSRAAMKKREQSVAARVSQISVSSSMLAERFAAYNAKLTLALNACDAAALPPIGSMPKYLERPVLGYVGTIGHWFDWLLLIAMAEENRNSCFRLVGPVYDKPSRSLPDNIEFLPACDHVTAINIMQNFSVGLIPFKVSELTASVDPIKYYEYRALGIPVVSSRFGEMVFREGFHGIFIVDKMSNHANVVSSAVDCSCSFEDVLRFRSFNSWEARFDSIGIFH